MFQTLEDASRTNDNITIKHKIRALLALQRAAHNDGQIMLEENFSKQNRSRLGLNTRIFTTKTVQIIRLILVSTDKILRFFKIYET